jgi:DNA-3-methyladenine glycosylase II
VAGHEEVDVKSHSSNGPTALTEVTLARGLRVLSARDPDLARILKHLGPPPLWARKPGFPTLVHIILEQQVSLASAEAAYKRLLAAASPLTPRRFLELDDAMLKAIGFSRQKTAYSRHLAESIVESRFNLSALGALDDAAARSEMIQIKGIGPWTADIYLLMALRRPDIWPSGDLALAVAVQRVKRLPSRPAPDELEGISVAWRPWRAVAARLLWHYYLSDTPLQQEKVF